MNNSVPSKRMQVQSLCACVCRLRHAHGVSVGQTARDAGRLAACEEGSLGLLVVGDGLLGTLDSALANLAAAMCMCANAAEPLDTRVLIRLCRSRRRPLSNCHRQQQFKHHPCAAGYRPRCVSMTNTQKKETNEHDRSIEGEITKEHTHTQIANRHPRRLVHEKRGCFNHLRMASHRTKLKAKTSKPTHVPDKKALAYETSAHTNAIAQRVRCTWAATRLVDVLGVQSHANVYRDPSMHAPMHAGRGICASHAHAH